MMPKYKLFSPRLFVFTVLFLAACGGQYSEDENIAMKQHWAEACGQMQAGVQTATQLGLAGHLTEAEAQVIDRVDIIYREVCTGPAVPLTDALVDVAVKAAVGELCPSLVLHEDVLMTVAEAALCAARTVLLMQLEAST